MLPAHSEVSSCEQADNREACILCKCCVCASCVNTAAVGVLR